MGRGRAAQSAAASILAFTLSVALATPALAHGGITGTQDVLQDYGVMLFLLAIVLIGAGVLAWVMLSPGPESEEEAPEAAPNGE
jgi:hypothetical protein